MSDSCKLRPLTDDEAELIGPSSVPGYYGAWKARADRPDLLGDIDYRCPNCDEVVVENTITDGIKSINKIECWSCGAASSGTGPLVLLSGEVIGAFCAIDFAPHAWNEAQVLAATDLASLTVSEIELRQADFDFQRHLESA